MGPSPVTSNGTDATEIEDEVSEDINDGELSPPNTNASQDSHATVGFTYGGEEFLTNWH